MRSIRDTRSSERGVVTVVVLFSLLFVFGLAAFAIDVAIAQEMRRTAQNSSDAAGLAGAGVLYDTGVDPLRPLGSYDFARSVDAVKEYAELNYSVSAADWTSCSDAGALAFVPPETGGTNCISFDSSTMPKVIRVLMPLRQSPTFFLGLTGNDAISVSAAAEVTLNPSNTGKCALCVIDVIQPSSVTTGDVEIFGGGSLYAKGGNLNGNNNSITVNDGGTAEFTEEPNIVGSGDPFENMDAANVRYPTGSPVLDPFASDTTLPPSFAGLVVRDTGSLNCPVSGLQPGIYHDVNGRNRPCPLEDGLYVFTGELDFGGNSSQQLTGSSVTLYFTCGSPGLPRSCAATGEEGGWLNFAGRGTLDIDSGFLASNARDESGQLVTEQSYVIAYDRANTSDLNLSGNAGAGVGLDADGNVIGDPDAIGGIVYAPSSQIRLDGTGSSGFMNILGPVVSKTLEFNGNGANLIIVDPSLRATFKYPSIRLTQ